MWRDLKNNKVSNHTPLSKAKQRSDSQKFSKFQPELSIDKSHKIKLGRQLSASKLINNVKDKSQNQSFYSKNSANLANKVIQDQVNASQFFQSPKQSKKSLKLKGRKKKSLKLQLELLSKNIKHVNIHMRQIINDVKNLVYDIFFTIEHSYNEFVSTFISQSQIMMESGEFNQNLAVTFGHGELQDMKKKMEQMKKNLNQNLKVAQEKLQPLKIGSQQSLGMIEIDSSSSPKKNIGSSLKNKFSSDSKSHEEDISTNKKVLDKIFKDDIFDTMHEIGQKNNKQFEKDAEKKLNKYYSHSKLGFTSQLNRTQSKASLSFDKKLNSINQFKRFSETLSKMKILMEQQQQN